ncbi:MAG: HDOD domain-containing protein [Gammaproteobacteria bacterium]|nr:HDOD domain-containing protein [Gammaproteobacteria bacterium]
METNIDESLLALLKQCKDLPTPPAVATKIIELSNKQNTDLDTLATIVAMDPALSAKILSIANSSMYMRRIEADSIEQAVGMFGWSGTLNLALGFAVVGSIRGALTSGLDYDYFWLRSLAAATSARALGQMASSRNAEVLFLPGLLQDIGMLALDSAVKDIYTGLGELQQDHAYIQQLEHKKVSTDHATIGEWLLTNWGVPIDVSGLVGLSHSSNFTTDNNDLLIYQKCVYLSGYLADCLMIDEERKTFEAVAFLMQKEMNISMSDFISLLGHVASQFLEMAALFDLQVKNLKQIQSITEFASLMLLSED